MFSVFAALLKLQYNYTQIMPVVKTSFYIYSKSAFSTYDLLLP